MNRRAAFARIGFTAGAALVASLTADDLFRAVGKELKKRESDNEIVATVAEELNNAGVAFSAVRCNPVYDPDASPCANVVARKCAGMNQCDANYNVCVFNRPETNCSVEREECKANVRANYLEDCGSHGCNCA